jgi:hypothetical protein
MDVSSTAELGCRSNKILRIFTGRGSFGFGRKIIQPVSYAGKQS